MVEIPGDSHVSVLSHPGIRVSYDQAGSVKVRRLYRIDGISGFSNYGVNNGDIRTMCSSLLERMYFCKVDGSFVEALEPDVNFLRSSLRLFRKGIIEQCKFVTPMTRRQVVETFRSRKRVLYEKAFQELRYRDVTRNDAVSKLFVKVEKVIRGKAPRAIQPRSPEYNLDLGRFIKACENKIYRAITKMYSKLGGVGLPVVFKGMNIQEMGVCLSKKWEQFVDPVAIGLDAVKFDMHVHLEMLGWEHSIYRAIYRSEDKTDRDLLSTLLLWQRYNKGKGVSSDGKLWYKVKGKRFSGDMNTALGNCLIMCGMIYSWLAMSHVAHAELVNNGDDAVVIIERKDLHRLLNLKQHFARFGFRMSNDDPVYELEHIEFCQMKPVFVDGAYVMVRNIHSTLEKDLMTVINISDPLVAQKYFTAIGDGGLACYGNVPVLGKFYNMLKRVGNNRRSRIWKHPQFEGGWYYHAKGVSVEERIDEASRYGFMLAFDIHPDFQIELEQYFDAVSVDWNVSTNFVGMDVLGVIKSLGLVSPLTSSVNRRLQFAQ